MSRRKIHDSARNLILHQIWHLPSMPGSWAANVLKTARTTGDLEVLAALAGRHDLDPEVLATLAGITDPVVRVALVANTTCPAEVRTRLLDHENRTAVLAPLLAHCPELVTARIKTILEQRPTLGLAKAIISAAAAAGSTDASADQTPDPTMVDRSLALIVERRPRLSDAERSEVMNLADKAETRDPDLAALAAATVSGPAVSGSRLGLPGLRTETRLQLLEICVEQADTWHRQDAFLRAALGLYQSGDAQPEVLGRFEGIVGARRGELDEATAERIEVLLGLCRHPDSLESLRRGAALGLETAKVGLLTHPDLTDEELNTVVEQLGSIPAGIEEVWGRLSPGTLECLAALDPKYFLERGGLEHLDPAGGAGRRVLERIRASGRTTSWFTPPVALVWVTGAAPELFGELTWDEIDRVASYRRFRDQHEQAALALLAEQTGDLSDEQWATFLGLCHAWEGTVGDLLAAASAL